MAIENAQEIPQLISSEELQKRVKELGAQISHDYANAYPLRIIGALKGCFVFMADLLKSITIPVKVDFMEISSYGDEMTTSGNIKIMKDLSHDIQNEHVLIAEDIIDTGLTLNHVMDLLYTRNPKSLAIASLLMKTAKQQLKFPARYVGFEIDDHFVVGYGLDYKGYMRNLPYIGVVTKSEQLNLFDNLK